VSRYLILGAGGQLGTALQAVLEREGHVTSLDRTGCDLGDPLSIRAAVRAAHPDVILNAAAYTAVDRAESEPELAMRINGEAPAILAEEAKSSGALLIHYSTDYVFDGTKSDPWLECDPVHPLNIYGATKLEGERNIQRIGGRFLIFRTSWVFSPSGSNFFRTMLRLGQERQELQIVDDQHGAPTSALALAKATRRILTADTPHNFREVSGIYHMTCSGETTWCAFAQYIFAHAKAQKPWASVQRITSSEYPTPAVRPANSVLSNQKLKTTFNVELPFWQAALDTTLQSLGILRD
jgi:dTDP-4-dehydrorhamnose reductase